MTTTIEQAKDALTEATRTLMTMHNSEGHEVVCIEPHLWVQLRVSIRALAEPVQEPDRYAVMEALRKALNKLPRYSFLLGEPISVRRVPDRYDAWIEWHAAHELFDADVVDHLLLQATPPTRPARLPPEQLLALLQTANQELDKVIKIFDMEQPTSLQDLDYKALYEQMCERCDSLDKALGEYEKAQSTPAEQPAPVSVIQLLSDPNKELRRDESGLWGLYLADDHIRYLNMFERNFVDSTIAAMMTKS